MMRSSVLGFELTRIVLFGVLTGLALSGPAQAQVAPSLLGEYLSGNTIVGTFSATVNCDPAGTTVTASASGVAIGPYPGTFEENVTLILGPQYSSPEVGRAIGPRDAGVQGLDHRVG